MLVKTHLWSSTGIQNIKSEHCRNILEAWDITLKSRGYETGRGAARQGPQRLFFGSPQNRREPRDGLCKEGSTCKPQDMVTRVGPLPGPKLGALQSCLILAKLNLLLGGLLLQPTGQPGHIEAHMGRQAQPGHTGADRGSQGTRGSSYHAGGSVDCSHSVLKQGKPRSSQPLKICNGTFIL